MTNRQTGPSRRGTPPRRKQTPRTPMPGAERPAARAAAATPDAQIVGEAEPVVEATVTEVEAIADAAPEPVASAAEPAEAPGEAPVAEAPAAEPAPAVDVPAEDEAVPVAALGPTEPVAERPPAPEPAPVAPAPVAGLPGLGQDEPAQELPRAAMQGVFAVNARLAEFVRGETLAALAYWRALLDVRSPSDLLECHLSEVNRSVESAIACWSDIGRSAGWRLAPRGPARAAA
ncbi:phasin family protein [uncultured Methylobacterium sp.]|jgi:hypothetical protein|uniref:phasin family protein n=1 Tax=uncultured Methylobacterium sp. TaxID=157278 RepID=UPI002602DED4|nr:phasin family protein [uncultured Methylobacterium sp.]